MGLSGTPSIPGYAFPLGCSSLFSRPTSYLSNLSQQSAFSRKFSSGLGWKTLLGDLRDPLSLAELKTLGLLVTQHGGRDGGCLPVPVKELTPHPISLKVAG